MEWVETFKENQTNITDIFVFEPPFGFLGDECCHFFN